MCYSSIARLLPSMRSCLLHASYNILTIIIFWLHCWNTRNKSAGLETSWSGSSRRDAFVLSEQMQECRRSRQATEAPDVSCAEGISRCNRCTLPFCSCTRACPRSSTAKRLVGWLLGRALAYCHMHYASDRALNHSWCWTISAMDEPEFNFNDFAEIAFLWYIAGKLQQKL